MRMQETPAASTLAVEPIADGGVRVAGIVRHDPILVLGAHVLDWSLRRADMIDSASLAPILDADPPVDLLLVGTGRTRERLPAETERALSEARLAVETMTSISAVRAYNALLADVRIVGLALIPNPDP